MFSRFHTQLLFALIVFDQASKFIASATLSPMPQKTWVPFISWALVHNTGAAYGLFQGQRLFLIAIAIFVIAICVIFKHTIAPTKWSKFGLIFLLAGAIGNLTDRLVHGYVIDFIYTPWFPVFNIADICIDIGIGLMILDMFLPQKRADQDTLDTMDTKKPTADKSS